MYRGYSVPASQHAAHYNQYNYGRHWDSEDDFLVSSPTMGTSGGGGGQRASGAGGGGGGGRNNQHHKAGGNNGSKNGRGAGHQPPRNHISPVVKCLLFSFNFLFWLMGAVISSAGFWIMVEKDKEVRDVLDVFFDPSILMCIAGCITFCLAFFGCLGALRENICLLKTFHVVLTVILLVELVVGIFIFVFYYVPSVRHQVGFLSPDEALRQAVVRYRDDDDLRDMIDVIQREFQCCGISDSDHGFVDWQRNMYFNCSPENPSVEKCGVPHSCCRVQPGTMINVMCGFDTTNKEKSIVMDKIFTQGCLKGFGTWLERNTIIVGAVCLGIILPQILGICLARTLIEQINLQKAQWA